MKLKNLTITAALLTLLAVGCSESDGPEDPAAPKTEFRLTADDLNTHLPGGIGESSIYLMGPDGAHIYKYTVTPPESRSFAFYVGFPCEIPGRGGEYLFTADRANLACLRQVTVISGIDENSISDKSPRELSDYFGELFIAVKKGYPAYKFVTTSVNENLEMSSKDFGEVVDYELNGDAPWFRYNFPENHTGKYRVFIFSIYHESRLPFWENMDPDMEPSPTIPT